MLLINLWLALASVVFIPIAILFSKYTGKMFNKYNNELWQIGSKNNTFLFDSIQKWREVKANNLQNSLAEEYTEKLKPEIAINIKWMKYFALDGLFYDFKNKFVQSLLLYLLGGLFIIRGQITIGSLLMFMSYMSSLSGKVDAIISSITGFSENKAVFDRIFKILDKQEKDREDIKLTCFNIDLENISFSYGEGLPCVLNNVSINFEYGKKYLIAGKSGEGKSTLIKLLLSLIKPSYGKIQINDIDLDSIKKQNIFKGIGTVMQENQFFNLSIKDNLKLIAPDATDDEIKEASKLALIDEFIESLPEKYDSVIGERGIKLSGGQKQRLAIARMILHKPQVAILDEATSSLDAVTEKQILSNLNDFFKGKTLIVISHKPALEIKFDKKIIVENEMILETIV
jgi:ATP-binding cassette subfamily B protein/subfamily B ATP-binding cassette protein MsbA